MHPIFRTHDETGRKAIYVNRLMTVGIVDMPKEESDPLLEAIFDHSERPEFVYTHSWRVGDLLVWDNRCSMHARTDFPSDQRRLMLRTRSRAPSGRLSDDPGAGIRTDDSSGTRRLRGLWD